MCAVHTAQVTGNELTEPEARFLAANEPLVDLDFADVEGISQGRQSRVSVLSYPRGDQTKYVIWKRMGVGKRLTRHEATEMWERLPHYKQALEGGGWTIPALLYSTVVDVSDVESQIFSYEQFIPGGDGDSMLSDPREPNFRKWHFVSEVLRVLYSYPEASLRQIKVGTRQCTLLPHGLDLKAANFVLEADSDLLYFIDLFGPKELSDRGRWRTYSPKVDPLPADNLRAVCATREGCILRFWRLARRLWEPDRERRASLTADFLERLAAVEPPRSEFEFVQGEISSRFPWLDRLYSERQV